VALTAATQPSIEEIALGALPGLPKVAVHWPLSISSATQRRPPTNFPRNGSSEPTVASSNRSCWWLRDPSPNEQLHDDGYMGAGSEHPAHGQPMTPASGSTG